MTKCKTYHGFAFAPTENVQVYTADGAYRQRISTSRSILDGKIHAYYDLHVGDIISSYELDNSGVLTHTLKTPIIHPNTSRLVCLRTTTVSSTLLEKIAASDAKNDTSHCRTKASLVQNVLLRKTKIGELVTVYPTNTANEYHPNINSSYPEISILHSGKVIDRHGVAIKEISFDDKGAVIVSHGVGTQRHSFSENQNSAYLIEHVQKGTLKLTIHCRTEKVFNAAISFIEKELENYEYGNKHISKHQRFYRVTAIADSNNGAGVGEPDRGNKPEQVESDK